jgi:DNA-directed RNA polymerase beta' subunit
MLRIHPKKIASVTTVEEVVQRLRTEDKRTGQARQNQSEPVVGQRTSREVTKIMDEERDKNDVRKK